ncbi:putative transcription factor interactor and regulator CCHC(Zn) family [Dioscorea sansibarensis]
MAGSKAKLLCSFGGDFVNNQGKALYVGGKTRLVSVDRTASFRSLLEKMSELCDADPGDVDVRFQLPDGSLDSRLVSIESDDDVRNMMDEFDGNRKIPIFLFTAKTENSDDDDDDDSGAANAVDDAMRVLDVRSEETMREMTMVRPEGLGSTSGTYHKREYLRNPLIGPSVSGESFRRDSQSLVVGQEYGDVQTFRNALTSAAIAANFELHMIRSDQRRVTARCAAGGCTWRVHASKLPHVSTFRIRTLAPEHTCERSDDAGHRQATAKWIANCIRDKLRHNRNYKPREILNDIHREYGVLITYKRAFLGREKALEELRAEPGGHMISEENSYDHTTENNQLEVQGWGEIHDPPRKKRAYGGPCEPKEVRPLHCTRCNQIGHNRRTCTALRPV